MWDIPGWIAIMDSLKPLLTGSGTTAVYLGLGVAVLCQVAVLLFGVYKVRQMFLEAED